MRPILIVNPRSDAQFVDRVHEMVDDGLDHPDTLTTKLRAWYPAVVVRPRELSSEPAVVWYVYRDGRWTSEGNRPGG